MKVKQGLKTAYNKPMNRENESGKYWRKSCGKVEIVAFLLLWWWYNLINVRQRGKERQMLTTLEIMELARDALRAKIHDKKVRIGYTVQCGYSDKQKQVFKKELEELQAKYKELEKMIVAEKDKMI